MSWPVVAWYVTKRTPKAAHGERQAIIRLKTVPRRLDDRARAESTKPHEGCGFEWGFRFLC